MGQKEQIKEITDKLQQGIEDLFQSDNYINYLKTMSKFTSYSFNNTLLIAMQAPYTNYVAGYKKWQSLGRSVCAGAKSIKILAPCIYKKEKSDKDDDTEESEEKVLKGFRVVSVFSYEQTTGAPLPDIVHKLNGDVDGYANFIEALRQFSSVPISFENISGHANGYYSNADKRIVIERDMSEQMRCKTGIHEVAHSILHDCDNGTERENCPDSRSREVQAESVAFVVMNHFGLDTSEYSFGYILGWSSGKELSELKASMEVIQKTSLDMINGIEEKLKAIQLDRSTEKTIDAPAKGHKRHLRR